MSRPPKIITRVIVFLLLGAIVNVAMAWGCAQFSRRGVSLQFETMWADVKTLMTDGSRKNFEAFRTSKGIGVEVSGQPGSNPLSDMSIVLAVGWPCRSLQCSAERRDDQWVISDWRVKQTETSSKAFFTSGLPLEHELPLLPIWPGFAINTIFYAAIHWLLLFAPGSVRRTIRRRRGLCPACAYPIGTSPVCTECGNAVKSRKEAAPDERASCDTAR